MTTEIDAVLRGLDKLRDSLQVHARLQFVNGLLSLADPGEVLPTPSVSLMAVETGRSIALAPSFVFRSVDALGPDGEQLLAPIQSESMQIHPWRVDSVIKALPVDPWGAGAIAGIDVVLSRDVHATPEAGWLTFQVESPEATTLAALRSAFASVDNQRLEWRPFPSEQDGVPTARRGTLCLDALCRNLVQLKIPPTVARSERLYLELRYRGQRSVRPDVSLPTLRTNVIPVWNSMPAVYPSPHRVGAIMSGLYNRGIHPLTTESLGPRWRAWRVDRVGAAVDAGTVFPAGDANGSAYRPDGGFRLAYVNLASDDRAVVTTVDRDRPALAVLIDDDAQKTLEARSQRLQIDFQATTGAACNGIPKGTEFQLVDLSGFLEPRIRGTLLHRTMGGNSGLASGPDEEAAVRPFLPSRRRRTVGDVLAYVRGTFGNELEISDPSRLLRRARGNTVSPLEVPVRFRQPTSRDEACVMLSACQALLADYLADDEIGPIALVHGDEHF